MAYLFWTIKLSLSANEYMVKFSLMWLCELIHSFRKHFVRVYGIVKLSDVQ